MNRLNALRPEDTRLEGNWGGAGHEVGGVKMPISEIARQIREGKLDYRNEDIANLPFEVRQKIRDLSDAGDTLIFSKALRIGGIKFCWNLPFTKASPSSLCTLSAGKGELSPVLGLQKVSSDSNPTTFSVSVNSTKVNLVYGAVLPISSVLRLIIVSSLLLKSSEVPLVVSIR